MNKNPKSFVMRLRRRYRVYFNPQGGSWYVAFHDGTQRQRRTLGVATRPEAEEAVKMLDQPPTAMEKARHRATWADIQKGFLQHKVSLDKSPGTVEGYAVSLNAFSRYVGRLGVQFVDEVSLSMLEGFKAFRTQTEGCDVITAYTNAITVKSAFKWASKATRGYLSINPALDWETPKPIKPKRRTYSAEDVARMEAGVRSWLRPVVTALAWTGMRINELVNLRWKDVDFERRLIHIRVQESWKPKGKRDRVIPMHPKVEATLKSLPLGEYVFIGPRGNQVKDHVSLRCLKADQEKLGLEIGDQHGFRRFFATTMLRNGVDVETVRQWGGWKSFNTMLRYLADVNATDSVMAMDQVFARMNAAEKESDKEMTKKPA